MQGMIDSTSQKVTTDSIFEIVSVLCFLLPPVELSYKGKRFLIESIIFNTHV